MRLFAALALPHSAVDRLLSLRLRLSSPQDGLRWSTPEQWHITLHFYGEVSEAAVGGLFAELDKLAHLPSANTSIHSLGLFQSKGILYATVAPTPELERLHAAVQQAGHACGTPAESRAFHPHVTLARSRGKTGDAALRRLATPEMPSFGSAVSWLATECLVLRSTLRPNGAEYEVVHRFELQQSPQNSAEKPA